MSPARFSPNMFCTRLAVLLTNVLCKGTAKKHRVTVVETRSISVPFRDKFIHGAKRNEGLSSSIDRYSNTINTKKDQLFYFQQIRQKSWNMLSKAFRQSATKNLIYSLFKIIHGRWFELSLCIFAYFSYDSREFRFNC